VIAYDPGDGKEIWRAKCLGGDAAPSPVLSGDLVIAVDPHHQTVAIRTDGAGDVTDTHVLWHNKAVGPEISSPAANDRHVFLTDTYGTLYAVDSKNGKLLYEYDFDDNVTSSPSLVAGKLYVLDLSGTMYIGMAGETEFTLESKNTLDEPCYASPAFMPGRIYIRGATHLYCIGQHALSS
jgi:outer membrane protein assembly factor BamB